MSKLGGRRAVCGRSSTGQTSHSGPCTLNYGRSHNDAELRLEYAVCNEHAFNYFRGKVRQRLRNSFKPAVKFGL